MAIIFTDKEIKDLIDQPKQLPPKYRDSLQNSKRKKQHKESKLIVENRDGSEFHIILRQSISNPNDFSLILAYRQVNTSSLFRLRRYNGKNHQHRNIIERISFSDTFHIHEATQRYQDHGMREDAYGTS